MATLTKDQEIARTMKRWYSDPWAAIREGKIFTLDQTDARTPVKQFPPKQHLEQITRIWEANPMLLVPKSRRMMLSWLMCYLHLWYAMFHPGRAIFIVSDKEQKSDGLVRMCEFMYTNIPDGTILKPIMRSKYCALEFPGLDSYIMGLPSGAAQLRQYTASALLFDEFAFWGDAMETLGAARPTIEGGGRLTIVSSAQDGPYKKLVFDETLA
jgi:phage FluMu gp28-like protein